QSLVRGDCGWSIADCGLTLVESLFSIRNPQSAIRTFCDRSKPQRVQTKLGTGTHGKDIANDSADACGRSLKWLDRAGVIVTFDFECDCPTVTNINDAGVFFARSDQYVRTSSRKFFELFTGVFVRAVLSPHHGKNSW